VPISGDWSTQIPAAAAPTALSAHAGNGNVQLSWETVDGATSYNILRGTSAGGESATPIGTTTGSGYIDSAVTNGTLYYYVVTASNVGGTSGPFEKLLQHLSSLLLASWPASRRPPRLCRLQLPSDESKPAKTTEKHKGKSKTVGMTTESAC
jgi:hypothetical protein